MITAGVELKITIGCRRVDGVLAELAEIGRIGAWAQIAAVVNAESGRTIDGGLMATAGLAAHFCRQRVFRSAFSLFIDTI